MPKKSKGAKRLVLLDVHAIIHRAYHALPDFATSKGEPTGALYGLIAMLLKVVSDMKPDYVVACYDLPDPTYRHEAYEGYKAGRAKTDEELVAQIIRSRDVFEAFGIPMYEKAGFEADDMLGTIVEKLKRTKHLDIVIASGDMDTLQLVDKKKVQVYTLKRGIADTVVYDEDKVVERFGFPPEHLPDFKGLRGDPSDNIIGIPGIGEKTASTLVQKFGTIEQLYKTLKKNPKRLEEAGIKPRILELLSSHEEEALFSKMLATIHRDAPIDFVLPEQTFHETLDVQKILALLSTLEFRSLAARVRDTFREAAPSQGTLQVEAYPPSPPVPPLDVRKVGIALWLLRSDTTSPTLDDILEYAGTGDFEEAKRKIFTQLSKEELTKVYEDIELPLIPIVDKMKDRGILLDIDYLKTLSRTYHKELSKLEQRIWKHAGGEFNINSPRQLSEILFDRLLLTARNLKKTGTGQRSTRESELEKLRGQHPIIEDIFAHRELQKLLSTYIDNLPGMVDEQHRLHAEFLQAGTTTGRMASQNPNLQNIPIRTEQGRAIRHAFVATPGFSLAVFDYSQIELRLAAILSKDQKLMAIFKDGGDVHRAVASEVFGVPPEHVDAEMRRRAKIINFGILYGMGVNALMQNLGTSRAEAQKFYNEYFKNFSGLAHYINAVKAEAERKGYTETWFGRRRYFEGIRSRLPHIKAAAERMAINAPMQGTQADIIKIAMRRVDDYLTSERLGESAYLLLQVHDELVYEVRTEKALEVGREIAHLMESVLTSAETGGVPILVSWGLGENWGSVEK